VTLSLQVKEVVAVLLADGWHEGLDDFTVDSYEYRDGDHLVHGVGASGLVAIAATWREGGQRFYCPVTSILALRCRENRAPGSAK